jgi:hypothetical protein
MIPVNGRELLKAELVGAKSTVANAGLVHELASQNEPGRAPGTLDPPQPLTGILPGFGAAPVNGAGP